MAYTPRPWVVSGSFINGPAGTNMDKSGDFHSIAEVFGPDSADNAKLIAAAPELLAAAKSIQEHCPCDYDINAKWHAAWDAMLAAIAKAEGR